MDDITRRTIYSELRLILAESNANADRLRDQLCRVRRLAEAADTLMRSGLFDACKDAVVAPNVSSFNVTQTPDGMFSIEVVPLVESRDKALAATLATEDTRACEAINAAANAGPRETVDVQTAKEIKLFDDTVTVNIKDFAKGQPGPIPEAVIKTAVVKVEHDPENRLKTEPPATPVKYVGSIREWVERETDLLTDGTFTIGTIVSLARVKNGPSMSRPYVSSLLRTLVGTGHVIMVKAGRPGPGNEPVFRSRRAMVTVPTVQGSQPRSRHHSNPANPNMVGGQRPETGDHDDDL